MDNQAKKKRAFGLWSSPITPGSLAHSLSFSGRCLG
jgi:hypothetical protein